MLKQLTNLTLHTLTVMDCTLDRKENIGLDAEEAFEQIKALAEATAKHNGEFVGLWHNTSLAANEFGYHRRLYAQVLEYVGRMQVKEPVALGKRIMRHIRIT